MKVLETKLKAEELLDKARKFNGKMIVVLDCQSGSVLGHILDFEIEEVDKQALDKTVQ